MRYSVACNPWTLGAVRVHTPVVLVLCINPVVIYTPGTNK
jgi:hypothetical protein